MSDALVKQRYTYIGELVVEVVVEASDGGISTDVNVLPNLTQPPEIAATTAPPLAPLREAVVAAPLEPPSAPEPDEIGPESALAVAPPQRRALGGFIRATYTLAFSASGEAIVYAVDNLGGLNLPPGLGLALGAAGYGIKRVLKPGGVL